MKKNIYTDDDMILWSIIGSLLTKKGKFEILSFSPKVLFNFFKISYEMKINLFICDSTELSLVIDRVKEYSDGKQIENIYKNSKAIENIRSFFEISDLLESLKTQICIEKEIIEDQQIKLETFLSKNYPNTLKKCQIPPFVLYYKGIFPKNHELEKSISIVGTRNPESTSIYTFVTTLFEDMKIKNDVIKYNVSGLALGCDSIGHRISMQFGIKNIAILGQGLGTKIYPKENNNLAFDILQKNGALISELPPSCKVSGIYLLQRNRLQIYFSEELLILESNKKGGTMTTLKYAISEKKSIYIRNIKKNHELFNQKNYKDIIFIDSYEDIKKVKESKKNSALTSNLKLFI